MGEMAWLEKSWLRDRVGGGRGRERGMEREAEVTK